MLWKNKDSKMLILRRNLQEQKETRPRRLNSQNFINTSCSFLALLADNVHSQIILRYKRKLDRGERMKKQVIRRNLHQIPYKQLSGWTVQTKLTFPMFLLHSVVVMKCRNQDNKEK